MTKLAKFLGWFLQSFGPLVVFLLAKRVAGLKAAIIAGLVWSLLDVLYVVWWRRRRPTAFFYFSVVTSLGFGLFDLYADSPFLFRYEGALTNVLTGLYFGATVFIGKPLIEEFAERARNVPDIDKPGARIYLRILTVVWTLYFFLKAGTYFVLAQSDMTFERATAIRSALGPLSFALLLGAERLLRPLSIRTLKKCGVIPRE